MSRNVVYDSLNISLSDDVRFTVTAQVENDQIRERIDLAH